MDSHNDDMKQKFN